MTADKGCRRNVLPHQSVRDKSVVKGKVAAAAQVPHGLEAVSVRRYLAILMSQELQPA